MSSSRVNTILAKNAELFTPTKLSDIDEQDQSRLIVGLDQNIIDDINKQIETKQKIMDNDPLFATVNNIFVNVIDTFYDLLKWIQSPTSISLIDVFFTGYRPISLIIFIIICYFAIKFIYSFIIITINKVTSVADNMPSVPSVAEVTAVPAVPSVADNMPSVADKGQQE